MNTAKPLAERLEFLRTPNDKLLVGVLKTDVDDLFEVVHTLMVKFELPLPDAICEDSEGDIKRGVAFTPARVWWDKFAGVWEYASDVLEEDVTQGKLL